MHDIIGESDPLPDASILAAGVQRALEALRRGGAVAVGEGAGRIVAAAVETLTQATLDALCATDGGAPMMAMTGPRAHALGLDDAHAVVAPLRDSSSLADIRAAADPHALGASALQAPATIAEPEIVAALKLAKMAELMPMLVVVRDARACGDAPRVDAEGVAHVAEESARWLTQVADARVPLADAEEARLIAFRPWSGGQEPLAIVIGTPDVSQPVLVRIHSSCFTGDLIGSLRCDCGDQLRGAISAISAQGAGVVVYLPQEGRGIGLVNKLRAYALQDAGFDTIDANTRLGFEPDERGYTTAGEILRRLGISRIRLLTNNPGKRKALAGLGVEVVDRVPLVIAANPHSEAYLRTKKLRDGHNF